MRQDRSDPKGYGLSAAAFAFIAVAVAMGAFITAGQAWSRANDAKQRAAAGGGGGGSAGATGQVTETEFKLDPAAVSVSKDGSIDVKNAGKLTHNLAVEGTALKTSDIKPGGSQSLVLKGLKDGTYTIYCTIPGHKEQGMHAALTVGAGGGAAHGAVQQVASGGGFNSKDQTLDPNATPPKDWTAKDPTLAPAPAGTVHDVELHATEKVMDVAPGVKQLMWSFNGQVPGPILHGRVGDTFNVKLINDGKLGHSIDFHASQTSMTNDMRTLNPGESLTYSFTAEYSGIWMYHCGTAPVLHHIGNGMYGAVVIDPPNLPPVQHEWVFVQSEQYYGPKNQPGDLAKMMAFKPDAVVFNGYPFQYKFSPLTAAVGDRIRAWVIDDGPSENSSFHIIGTIFDTVFKEGAYLLRPGNAESGGSQAMDLQPAQGGFVELQVRKPGQYAMVTHKFQNPGIGALGMIMAK